MPTVIDFSDQLDTGYSWQGEDDGAEHVSVIVTATPPGDGPELHTHPYEEVFVVLEGAARFTIGNETVDVRAGQIAIAPAGAPHGFVTLGEARLRSVNIHAAPRFATTWLAPEQPRS